MMDQIKVFLDRLYNLRMKPGDIKMSDLVFLSMLAIALLMMIIAISL